MVGPQHEDFFPFLRATDRVAPTSMIPSSSTRPTTQHAGDAAAQRGSASPHSIDDHDAVQVGQQFTASGSSSLAGSSADRLSAAAPIPIDRCRDVNVIESFIRKPVGGA